MCISKPLCTCHLNMISFVKFQTYRKIPNISPGLIAFRKHIFGGLHSVGLISGGAYIWRAFCFWTISRTINDKFVRLIYRLLYSKASNKIYICLQMFIPLKTVHRKWFHCCKQHLYVFWIYNSSKFKSIYREKDRNLGKNVWDVTLNVKIKAPASLSLTEYPE